MSDEPPSRAPVRDDFPRRVPPVDAQALLSIDTVTLPARDVPALTLRRFYAGILGLSYEGPLEEGGLAFRQGLRSIRLVRDGASDARGRLGLAVRRFDQALDTLHQQRVRYDLHRTDGGLSRWLLLRDPAGNWIYLYETRPL